MATRKDFADWVRTALVEHGGEAKIVDVARHIWDHHEAELRESGDLFFRWQYDMRWAVTQLRNEGKVAGSDASPKGSWALKS